MASELTSSPAELLAEAVNTIAGNSAASALTMSYGELWGAYYSEVVGGSSPHKTMSIPAMMAGIANELGGSVSHLTSTPAELAAAIGNAQGADPQVSALTSSPGQLLATISNSAGGGGDIPDFTGWSAGSEAGVYTDGETGGKFPTGCMVNLGFDEGEDPTLEITEATHTVNGVEAITFSLTAVGNGCAFELIMPAQGALEGQTWALNACIRVDGGDAEPGNVFVSLQSDVEEIAFSDGAIQTGGNLANSLRTIDGAVPVDTTSVHGSFSFFLPAGSVTITLALKLEQVS